MRMGRKSALLCIVRVCVHKARLMGARRARGKILSRPLGISRSSSSLK